MPTITQHIPEELIEKALALTSTPIETVEHYICNEDGYDCAGPHFSIEKFCYYLLSPSFVKKYREECTETNDDWDVTEMIGTAIFEYQDGDVEPLNEVLSKI